jgi:poly(3-hydroxybutyrate) depolymerase
MGMRRGSSFTLFAVAVWIVASCDGGSAVRGGETGAAGAGPTGTAGASATGGGSAAGEAGAAGSSTTGTAMGAAGSGVGGAGGADSADAGGMGAADGAGAAGSGAAGTSAGKGPTGMSEGCGSALPAGETPGKYVHHSIVVTGVDPAVKPATSGGSWTNRDYYLDLPAGYDPSIPYPVLFGGGGCGGALVTNGNGAFAVLPANNTRAIQIGLSYVWPQGGGACFYDGGANTPDLPYFDAILKEVETKFCVDKGKVFVGGYSSGAWETYTLGLARGGVVRGISPAAGGLRMNRPPGSQIGIAALLLTGGIDMTNPATGPSGSDAAMNLILQINGCKGTDTVPWETACAGCACNRYTGCPAAYPVVRCRPPNQAHTDGGGAFKTAIWATWSTLLAP